MVVFTWYVFEILRTATGETRLGTVEMMKKSAATREAKGRWPGHLLRLMIRPGAQRNGKGEPIWIVYAEMPQRAYLGQVDATNAALARSWARVRWPKREIEVQSRLSVEAEQRAGSFRMDVTSGLPSPGRDTWERRHVVGLT